MNQILAEIIYFTKIAMMRQLTIHENCNDETINYSNIYLQFDLL